MLNGAGGGGAPFGMHRATFLAPPGKLATPRIAGGPRTFPTQLVRGAGDRYRDGMALEPDDTVCFCFHVTLRKIETFCRVEKPQAASQISDCLSAGTGCGWCVPMLERIHRRICGQNLPWWRNLPEHAPNAAEAPRGDETTDAAAYRAGRRKYLDDGKGTPAPGAEI